MQDANHPGRLFQHPIILDFIDLIWYKHARGYGNAPLHCSELYSKHDLYIPQETVALAMTVISVIHIQQL